MKAFLILSSVVFSFGVAHADTISFQVTELDSSPVNRITELRLYIEANGKIMLNLDPNHCGNPGPCTQIKVAQIEVQPTIIRDNRELDGALLVKLTDNINLEVTSGETIDGKVHTFAQIKESDGTTKTLELTAVVNAKATKQ